MGDFLDFLVYFKDLGSLEPDFSSIFIAVGITAVFYLLLYFFRKYVMKSDVENSAGGIREYFLKFGFAFIVEFGLIWLYGSILIIPSIVLGVLTALYFRNKVFSFLDLSAGASSDLSSKMELNELKSKFKKNPHYSILEVLYYYGYISQIQKETVEAENIFKSPDEMANELLDTPILTKEQLKEAKGIMNVIRIEGKVITREEAILHIAKMEHAESLLGEDNYGNS